MKIKTTFNFTTEDGQEIEVTAFASRFKSSEVLDLNMTIEGKELDELSQEDFEQIEEIAQEQLVERKYHPELEF